MANDILNVKKLIGRSDEITSQQYHTYSPYSTSFNNNDEIRITIQSQDLYILPSDSHLFIEFIVARRTPAPNEENAPTFPTFFIAHLFNEMRYELEGVEIGRCKLPGITTTMKNFISCKTENMEILKLFNLHSGDNVIMGTHRMLVPLKFVFGFCDDFNQIILNSKHELILVRHRTDASMYIGDAGTNLMFTINKIQWEVPHVTLSDETKLLMLRTIARNDSLLIPFRSWDLYELPVIPQTTRHTWSVKTTSKVNKPRFVIVGLQTNRANVSNRDPSLFDHCNITNMKLSLNNERFPYDDYNLNFNDGNCQELYLALTKIQRAYYNGTGGNLPIVDWPSYSNFLTRTLFTFDCTRSDESIKTGMVDVRIEIESSQNIPANTSAYCLIIHDNLFRYSPFTSMVQREI